MSVPVPPLWYPSGSSSGDPARLLAVSPGWGQPRAPSPCLSFPRGLPAGGTPAGRRGCAAPGCRRSPAGSAPGSRGSARRWSLRGAGDELARPYPGTLPNPAAPGSQPRGFLPAGERGTRGGRRRGEQREQGGTGTRRAAVAGMGLGARGELCWGASGISGPVGTRWGGWHAATLTLQVPDDTVELPVPCHGSVPQPGEGALQRQGAREGCLASPNPTDRGYNPPRLHHGAAFPSGKKRGWAQAPLSPPFTRVWGGQCRPVPCALGCPRCHVPKTLGLCHCPVPQGAAGAQPPLPSPSPSLSPSPCPPGFRMWLWHRGSAAFASALASLARATRSAGGSRHGAGGVWG